MKKQFLFIIALTLVVTAEAQMKVGPSPTVIDPSAMLQIDAAATGTRAGVLLPRIALSTTTTAAPCASHVAGMFVYNTATAGDVTPGIYYNDGTKWVRSSQANQFNLLYGSGAPSISCSSGALYTDTLSSSPTVGQQWTCSGGTWVSYNAPAATEWYLESASNDAGSDKLSGIYRLGSVALKSSTLSPAHSILMVADPSLRSEVFFLNGASTGNNSFSLRSGMTSTPGLSVMNVNTNTPMMHFSNASNVGIGTSSPRARLDIPTGTLFMSSSWNSTYSIASGLNSSDGTMIEGDGGGLFVQRSSSGAAACVFSRNGALHGFPAGPIIAFYSTGANVGQIGTDGGSTQYYTTSDRRLKENIRDTRLGISDLMKIGIKDYNYIGHKDILSTGVIAQQLYEVYPAAVHKGGTDSKNDPWMVDYSKLTPLLVKAMQDQQQQIEDLKKEVANLRDLIKK